MKNINSLSIKKAIIFDDGKHNKLILIENETEVILKTDNTDFEEFYSGVVTFINEDGIEVENSGIILWGYVTDIDIIT